MRPNWPLAALRWVDGFGARLATSCEMCCDFRMANIVAVCACGHTIDNLNKFAFISSDSVFDLRAQALPFRDVGHPHVARHLHQGNQIDRRLRKRSRARNWPLTAVAIRYFRRVGCIIFADFAQITRRTDRKISDHIQTKLWRISEPMVILKSSMSPGCPW